MSKTVLLKILTAGDGGVGKTTLLHRYIKGTFSIETKMTIGVQFFNKNLLLNDTVCKLQLWDFGGQEQFRFLLDGYVRGAKGALLIFDLTRPHTLDNLEEWINLVRKFDDSIPIIFLGSKLDLIEEDEFDDQIALSLKKKYGFIDYLKISSKTGENVNESIELLVHKILERYR